MRRYIPSLNNGGQTWETYLGSRIGKIFFVPEIQVITGNLAIADEQSEIG
jgi:hypothetical protein